MQVILGANGVIAKELSKLLPRYTNQIRQVSRHPQRVNVTDELLTADLCDYNQTERAIEGCDVAYLVAGLKYDIKVWRKDWPVIMQNVMDACARHNCKLIFFDNVYAYGHVDGVMTESTPFNPNSRKGEVRAAIATRLLEAIKSGNINGAIVRAADFYGPDAALSIPHIGVFERLPAGKTPQWIGDPKKIHTFTYTPDAARTLALVGNTPAAINQTWHAVTSKEKMTGQEFIRIATTILNLPPGKILSLGKTTLRLVGLFEPVLREFVEMMYQFDADYVFDSTKTEKTLGIAPSSYYDGINEILVG